MYSITEQPAPELGGQNVDIYRHLQAAPGNQRTIWSDITTLLVSQPRRGVKLITGQPGPTTVVNVHRRYTTRDASKGLGAAQLIEECLEMTGKRLSKRYRAAQQTFYKEANPIFSSLQRV